MKRSKIRWISFSLCAVVLVGASAVFYFNQKNEYERQVNNVYSRAFYNLVDAVRAVDSSLEKGIHSGSPAYLVSAASEIWRETGSAKAALAQLPLSDTQMDACYKFLSQAGDYAYMLTRKVVNDEEITQEEQQTLESLSSYAKSLNESLSGMQDDINAGYLSLASFDNNFSAPIDPFEEGMGKLQENFEGYPTLIYDGPFSDHLDQAEPAFLKNKEELTQEEGAAVASKILGVPVEELKTEERQNGDLKTYSYTLATDRGLTVLDLTAQGGAPVYLLNDRAVAEPVLSTEEGIAKAKEFLGLLGFTNMKESYYLEQEGILTINFAFRQGDYTCYPDLVKVGVAMDDGSILLLESRGYLMNHKARDIPAAKLTKEAAKAKLSDRLTPQSYELAVIPTDFQTELPVYSFVCTNSDGRRYVVCINTQTGNEEKILMLHESEQGTLAS